MSEERMKILEMLSSRKISVEEAYRLLGAISDDSGESSGGKPRGSTGGDNLEDDIRRGVERVRDAANTYIPRVGRTIEEAMPKIRKGVEDVMPEVERVRETVRASMPQLRKTIEEAMPDVERLIREATDTLPRIFEDMGKTFSQAFGDLRGAHGDVQYPEHGRHEFEESVVVEAARRLVLHNPRGSIEVVVWEEDRVSALAKVDVQAVDAESAQRHAEAVKLESELRDQVLHLTPTIIFVVLRFIGALHS